MTIGANDCAFTLNWVPDIIICIDHPNTFPAERKRKIEQTLENGATLLTYLPTDVWAGARSRIQCKIGPFGGEWDEQNGELRLARGHTSLYPAASYALYRQATSISFVGMDITTDHNLYCVRQGINDYFAGMVKRNPGVTFRMLSDTTVISSIPKGEPAWLDT
jgi:hypothetical protein